VPFFQDAEKTVGEPTLSAHHGHLLTKDLAASSGIQDPNSLLQSLGTSTPRCSVDIWLVNREIYEGKPDA